MVYHNQMTANLKTNILSRAETMFYLLINMKYL